MLLPSNYIHMTVAEFPFRDGFYAHHCYKASETNKLETRVEIQDKTKSFVRVSSSSGHRNHWRDSTICNSKSLKVDSSPGAEFRDAILALSSGELDQQLC